MSGATRVHHESWKNEASIIDLEAERLRHEIEPTDPLTLARYGASSLRQRFSRAVRVPIAGDLRRKTLVDVGCGDGADTVLLAQLGAARVVGIDFSPKALENARMRARVNGVDDRVDFVCAPAETADLPSGS